MAQALFTTNTTGPIMKNQRIHNPDPIPFSPRGTVKEFFFKEKRTQEYTIAPLHLPLNIKQHLVQNSNLQEEDFAQVHNFVEWGMPNAETLQKTLASLLLLLVRKQTHQGSTCLSTKHLYSQMRELFLLEEISHDRKFLQAQFRSTSFSWLLGNSWDTTPLVWNQEYTAIYTKKMWEIEQSLFHSIQQRLKLAVPIPPISLIREELDQILTAHPLQTGGQNMIFSEQQIVAILLPLFSPLTFISGGPGTGKTSIVVMILRLLFRLGVIQSISLAAPTGRAAKHMRESIERSLQTVCTQEEDQSLLQLLPEPQTLHRLLGYHPHTHSYLFHQNHPLSTDVLIIDESSMIDISMMDQIWLASTPSHPTLSAVPRLIFLGDANQLPSVGAGAVLRDFIPQALSFSAEFSNTIQQIRPDVASVLQNTSEQPILLSNRITRLTESYRQKTSNFEGKNILAVANAVLAATSSKELNQICFQTNTSVEHQIALLNNLSDYPFAGVSLLSQNNEWREVAPFIPFWMDRFFCNPEIRSLIEQQYDEENLEIEKLDHLFHLYSIGHLLTLTRHSSTGVNGINAACAQYWKKYMNLFQKDSELFFLGAPIIVLKNDYENELFNGDRGIVLQMKHGNKIEKKVVFQVNHTYRTYSTFHFTQAQLSYAITVHKSQGSEYEHIALILPKEFTELLNKELLYTAITRAKRSVLVVGDKQLFLQGSSRKMQRMTGLATLLEQTHCLNDPSSL